MSWSKKIIIAMLILTSSLSSDSCLEGSVFKLLNNETTEKFIQERIYFEYPFENRLWSVRTKIDKNANFSFGCKKFPTLGAELQLKLSNKDYFILSPFNGQISTPNKKSKYKKILIISKKSPIFLKTCLEVTEQTIQVLVTKSKEKAETLVTKLQNDCKNKKGNFYCKKHIKYEAFLENNMLNNLAYKVYYGKYFPDIKSQKELKNTLYHVQKYYSKKAWIRPYIKIKEECR